MEKNTARYTPLFFVIVLYMPASNPQKRIKLNTSAEYPRRINRALEFIDSHLDQSLQLDDVARASHFSAYHFHRIFHALVGETVNEYVSRKRLEKAAKRLISRPELSITNVSEAGGYSSSANFSKAFKLYFGLSPSELRNCQSNEFNGNKVSKKGKLYRKLERLLIHRNYILNL